MSHESLSAYGAEGDKSPPRKPLKRETPAGPAKPEGGEKPAPGAAEPPAPGS